jgi:hypothetical protein
MSDRCWFDQCRYSGELVDLDGAHPRVLCVTHAMGVRLALEAPGRYEVRWGMTGAEKIARDEATLRELEAIDTSMADRPDWDVEPGDRGRSMDADDVRWQITELRTRIGETDPRAPPVVGVKAVGRRPSGTSC